MAEQSSITGITFRNFILMAPLTPSSLFHNYVLSIWAWNCCWVVSCLENNTFFGIYFPSNFFSFQFLVIFHLFNIWFLFKSGIRFKYCIGVSCYCLVMMMLVCLNNLVWQIIGCLLFLVWGKICKPFCYLTSILNWLLYYN